MNSVKSSLQLPDDTVNYKHTDPPWLWISVFIGSISLHLLVFWFLRSSDQFQPWIPQANQDQIAIDLIDIPDQVESKSTDVKPQFPSTNQKSVTESSLPKTTINNPENPNDQVINSDINFSQQQESKNSQLNNQSGSLTPKFTPEIKPQIKPQIKSTPKPKPTTTFTGETKPQIKPEIKFTPTPIPTPIQTIPLNDLPWNRRQEVKLGEGTLLPNDVPSDSPIPTPKDSTTPTPETSPIPTPEDSTTPTPENRPVSQGGSFLANVDPILKDEVEQLRQDGKLRVDALPDVLAAYQGSPTKELEINILPSDSGLKSATILASLVIDKNGNFQQAVIINIEPATLRSEKSIYEQALNEIFQQDSFVAGYNQDGTKPGLSNLYMRIRIEPINKSQ